MEDTAQHGVPAEEVVAAGHSYQYDISVGFSYSFGSIHNNVVNTRFQGSNGGMIYCL